MPYRLKQAFPDWRLSGVDLSADYIAAAAAAPELAGIDFSVASVFAVTGRWDVVISTGVVEIFTDPAEVLQKLISLVAPGGLLVVDGRFNPLDVDVRMQFRDRSPGSRSQVWNTDWNLHAQRTVREILDGRVASLRFEEVAMDADLPYRPDQPAIRTWTFRDAAGRNLQTNGAGILKNKHLLIARR
jgi:SAM-dependent methyltransferase